MAAWKQSLRNLGTWRLRRALKLYEALRIAAVLAAAFFLMKTKARAGRKSSTRRKP